MSTENSQPFRQIADLSRAISVILLLLHCYYFCYYAFEHWKLTATISDRLLQHISETGLFRRPELSKALALAFLLFALPAVPGRKSGKVTYRSILLILLTGLLFYFGSDLLLLQDSSDYDLLSMAILYMSLTVVGFILLLTGAGRFSRILPSLLRKKDPFGRDQAGFPQEERKRQADFSLHLRASYTYKGKAKASWVNLLNPRRGVLIVGNPGSSKTWLIVEPLIRQLIENGLSLFVFDYKFDDLSRLTYHFFRQNRDKYPASAAFYSINFTDLSRSHRCNVIEPRTLTWLSDALGSSRTTLLSLNKNWVHKQGEFFVESPVSFLGALIWFLRKYCGGVFCTLPHVIELSQVPYNKLFAVLEKEPEIKTLIDPFLQAYKDGNMELLNSQVASAKIPLGRLASPDIYWVLTGSDFSLEINDPSAPKVFCLGGDPVRQEALAPVLSLYIDRLNKMVNQKGKHPCALVCEEFATVRAASILTTIATARSNNIIPIIVLQDLSQARMLYSRDEADLLLNISGNLLCGQVGGETARLVSERFPKILQDRTSISTNSSDTSINQSQQWEMSVTPATIAALSSGEFLGLIADNPGEELEYKAFHAKLDHGQAVKDRDTMLPLPVVHNIDEFAIQENFLRVRKEVLDMVEMELRPAP